MHRGAYFYAKAGLDRLVAIIGLLVLSPVFLLIALLLKLSSIGKVFFVHQRPGLNCKPIYLIKFKTMNDRRDTSGELLPNKNRITRLGRILRNTSLDEIPQLINVLKGDISFIGPRPLEMRYLPLYTPEQNKRHQVKPGISGWAQVNGRNAISWEEKFKYDLYYVNNVSFGLDMKILWLTIKKVILKEGINSSDEETVTPLDVYLKTKKKNDI